MDFFKTYLLQIEIPNIYPRNLIFMLPPSPSTPLPSPPKSSYKTKNLFRYLVSVIWTSLSQKILSAATLSYFKICIKKKKKYCPRTICKTYLKC